MRDPTDSPEWPERLYCAGIMSAATPPLDPVLARDYPHPFREAYRNAVRRGSLAERHQQLLRLGEVSLAYLASLAFADYRRSSAGESDQRVEEFLASTKRFTMGQYLALFRMTQRALGRQEIFGLKRHEVNVRLEHAQRWVSAVRGIEYAQKVGASDISRVVEEALKQPAKGVRWLAFWDELVTYRNQIAHADANGWPVDALGYFEAMTPALEAALIDALRTEYIGYVLLEYPAAQLLDVRWSGEGWVQRFDGEYHGVPLLEAVVREAPPEPWESEVGCAYVLQRFGDRWLPHSRFYDLSHGVPEALPPGGAPREERLETAPYPIAAGSPAVSPSASGSHRAEDVPGGAEQVVAPPDSKAGARSGDVAPGPDVSTAAGTSGEANAHRGSGPPSAGKPTGVTILSQEVEQGRRVGPGAPSSEESPAWFPSFSPWMLWGILSFGLFACVGFLAVAARIRDTNLRNAGFAYTASTGIIFVGAAIVGDSDAYPVLDAILLTLLVGTWVVSTVHAFAVNPRIRRARPRAVADA